MKLVYHSLGNLDRLAGYAEEMQTYLDEVSRDDTEVELAGTTHGGIADTYRFFASRDEQSVATTIAKKRDEVDGIAIGNILDPALREGREITSIPVLGLGETSYLVATTVAETAAVVPLSPKWEPMIRDRIRMYGLETRIPMVQGMNIELEEMSEAFFDDDKAQTVLDGFDDVVSECVDEGVEMIIPGGGIISMLLNREGIDELHGVPIMDQITVLVRLTETYVDLYQLGALQTSECRMYQSPDEAFLEELFSIYGLE